MLMLACASIYMDAQSFWFKELLISGLVVVYLYVSLHHHSVDFCFSHAQWQSLCWGLHRKWNKDLMSPSGDWNFTSNHLAKGSNPSFCIIFLKILGELGPLPSSSLGFATGFTHCYLKWLFGLKPGFKILVEIGTTRPSRIRLGHGRYQIDTQVGYFFNLWTNSVELKINEQSRSESHGNFETTPRSCWD